MNARVDPLDVSLSRLDAALDQIEELLTEAAEARADYDTAEERKKQVLAEMTVFFREDGHSMAEADARARKSNQYQSAAADWSLAGKAWRRADAKAEARRLRLDVWRTVNATERAKINMR